jgi:1,4-dihydroxy-2-naphthoyl-CoA synthase
MTAPGQERRLTVSPSLPVYRDKQTISEPVGITVTRIIVFPLLHFYNPLVRRLRSLPMPIVCAVNGVAASAGANVAVACDIVIAARSGR